MFRLLIVFLFISFAVNSSCLKSGDYVELSGKLVVTRFPNPLAEGDSPEENKPYFIWMLELDNPLSCVTEVDDETFKNWNKEIQLFHGSEIGKDEIERLKNKHVVISGELSVAGGAPSEFSAVGMDVEKAIIAQVK
ncbi:MULTISPECIES: hypothetical protein [Rahnella]|uniref:DUF4431 domain-containing protein n=1 Tax=Rahnella variigena TaxID=574964 RepID=A0ABX9PPJ2_9GAMM|nr:MULTISPECIES: hypothetical protein [Rahnella]RJT49869.1 hypothetical protein D6D38_22575 [Rahnella variigena]RKF66460.1 hypothetical protein CKQ54_24045 [Rahnella variigena]